MLLIMRGYISYISLDKNITAQTTALKRAIKD